MQSLFEYGEVTDFWGMRAVSHRYEAEEEEEWEEEKWEEEEGGEEEEEW